MLDYQQQLSVERNRDYRRAAIKSHQRREALGERPSATPFYAPALDRLGRVLIETGLNLRVRYGRLDLGEGVEA